MDANMDLCIKIFSNDVILRRMAQFLPVNDLKSCRLVNRKWCRLVDIEWKKKAWIYLNLDTTDFAATCMLIYRLSSFLNDMRLVPYNKICITGKMSKKDLCLFNTLGTSNFCTLKLDTIYVMSETGTVITELDAKTILCHFPTIKRLHINCYPDHSLMINANQIGTTMTLEMKEIVNMQYIYLHGCKLILDGTVLKPIHIELEHVDFVTEDNDNVIPISTTTFLNLCDAKVVLLPTENVLVDMTEPLKLNTVHVACVDSYSSSKWIAENMMFSGISILEQSEMKCNSVAYGDCKVNLSVVPTTVHTMLVYCCENWCDSNVFLPHLTRLAIEDKSNVSWLSHLQYCNSLKQLHIERASANDLDLLQYPSKLVLPIELIPESVEVLSLHNVNVVGKGIRRFKQLTFRYYNINVVMSLIQHLQTDNLAIKLRSPITSIANFEYSGLTDLLLTEGLSSLAIGYIACRRSTELMDVMINCGLILKPGSYFLWERDLWVGRPIPKIDFMRIIDWEY